MVNECFLPVMNLFPENCRSIKNGCPSNIKNGDFPLMCRPAFLPVLYDLVIIPHPLTLFFLAGDGVRGINARVPHASCTHPIPGLGFILPKYYLLPFDTPLGRKSSNTEIAAVFFGLALFQQN